MVKICKILSFIFIAVSLTLLISLAITSTTFAAGEIRVTVNGENIVFDVPPMIINDRTMIPIRAVFERLNAKVEWDAKTKTVIITSPDHVIRLTVDKLTAYVDGAVKMLDVAPVIINDRVLVPVRFISESLNAKVDWIASSRTVVITYPNPINVIVYDSMLLGSWNGAWVDNEKTAASITGNEKYYLYSKTGLLGTASGPNVTSVLKQPDEWNGPWTESVNIKYNNSLFKGLAVSNEIKLGKFEEQNTNNQTYINYIGDLLSGKGLTGEKVRIQQIIRTDLENDGVEEVIINASNYGYTDKVKGIYSIVVMRKVISGQVNTIILSEDISLNKSEWMRDTYTVLNIADFNADKIMEILIGFKYHEGWGYLIYTVSSNGKPNRVLASGIGA